MMSDRLKTELSGLTFNNPVISASGTFGYGHEIAEFYDINTLGALTIKGTTLNGRYGNPLPRIAECSAGLLNAIGLQNPGVDEVISCELPKLRKVFSGHIIANISGFSVEEYAEVARRFDSTDVSLLEINISCPNVEHGGMAFGVSPGEAAKITSAVKAVVKKPVYMKLSPNVTDIAAIAKACEDAGADGLTLINTLLGMRIDPRGGTPVVSTGMAGLSGPAVKPVAIRMVYQTAGAVDIPIIGAGGISSADDVLEMLWAGASAVQIGSANLINPFACRDIIYELTQKMDRYGISSIKQITGRKRDAKK